MSTPVDHPIKVVVFCPQYLPVVGGAERQAHRQASELVRQGIEVELWTPILDPTSLHYEEIDGVAIHRFDLFHWPRNHWLWRHFAFLNGPSLLAQIVLRTCKPIWRAHLIHCHMFGLATLGVALCALLLRKPVICKAAIAGNGSDILELARTSPFNRLVAPLGRFLFDRWIATTNAVALELVRAGVAEHRIVKIPNGIDVSASPKVVLHVRRFLYVGRLSTNINRDTDGLVSAFDKLSDEVPDVELILVGGGDLLEHTHNHAMSKRNKDKIHVLGFGDPAPWLDWADCFVIPSRNEGLSNALLEAMERGLVCVANDIGPNREVLDGGASGVLVPVEDVNSLKSALLMLTSNSDLASTLSRAARRRVEQAYSLPTIALKLIELYSSLLDEPG